MNVKIYSRIFLSATLLVAAIPGCRSPFLRDDVGFRDHPAMPRQNFGRPGQEHGQMGLDQRARDIESSLGIEGGPPRFFRR